MTKFVYATSHLKTRDTVILQLLPVIICVFSTSSENAAEKPPHLAQKPFIFIFEIVFLLSQIFKIFFCNSNFAQF